jgi:alkanesulfonate monooxygenase SsuD/methylene tetrahydromethanopterin reductase-like flavin-dependent oxidoreductase (luciferase family)
VPPILLGAVNPGMAELAAQQAAGVVTWAAGKVTVREVLAPAARRSAVGAAFRVVTVLPLCVTSEPAAARELVRARLGANDRFPSYRKVLAREGVESVADLAVVGSEDECAAALDELAASGTTDFGAHLVVSGDAERDRTWEFLAARAAA